MKHFVTMRHHKKQVKERDTAIAGLIEALDTATDLMTTPEHFQDDDWYRKAEEVNKVLDEFKEFAAFSERAGGKET